MSQQRGKMALRENTKRWKKDDDSSCFVHGKNSGLKRLEGQLDRMH
jgi:hypothetical protein